MKILLTLILLIITSLCWLPAIALVKNDPKPHFKITEQVMRSIFYWTAIIASYVIGIITGLLS